MKTLGKILVLVMLFSFSQSEATDPGKKKSSSKKDVTTVKLMPADPGFIKVLYVNASTNSVLVSIRGDEIHFNERINLKGSDKGFIKRYDLSKLEKGSYVIEVSDATMSIEFQVDKLADNRLWAKYWDAYVPEPETADPIIASVSQ